MNEKDYAKLIAKNLRRIFYEHGKTQAQVAQDLGINKATLSSWMNGTRIPRMKKIDLLCHYFNCTRADIMEEHSDASWAYLLQAFVGDNKELQSLLVDVTKLNKENREIIASNVSRLLDYQEGNKSICLIISDRCFRISFYAQKSKPRLYGKRRPESPRLKEELRS